jgi:hypothetical protein
VREKRSLLGEGATFCVAPIDYLSRYRTRDMAILYSNDTGDRNATVQMKARHNKYEGKVAARNTENGRLERVTDAHQRGREPASRARASGADCT